MNRPDHQVPPNKYKLFMCNHKRGLAPLLTLALFLLCFAMLSGCSTATFYSPEHLPPQGELVNHWPHGVFYEIFVQSFYDSNGDGIGDINGMTEKLDYLQELGIEGIWLMPISPSPSYHKYDVTDYYGIDPDYGTLEDFKAFVQEAHARNIKVIIDLVVNHSSSEHPWFKETLSSADNPYRDWYVWADETTNLHEAGEWGQQVWHGSRNNQYYGLFWSGMPDLNFDHPPVRQEMINIGRFWLEEMGVDGFRLDAAKHIYSHNELKNHEWWLEFRQAMQQVKEDVFLVGEVWAPATTVAPYLEDRLHSAFNFDLAQKLVSSAQAESDTGAVSSLERMRSYFNSLSEDYIDSTFITNHDMNRVMSELRGDLNQAKMAASLLLTLPGSPFIYYGEEIGMEGMKPDEHIREPMLWYTNPAGTGQTTWIRPKHNLENDSISVEAQLEDSASLYHHYKTMIYTRRSSDTLVLGELETSLIREKGIIAFKRVHNDDELLVIHNMSRENKSISMPEQESAFTTAYFSSHQENKSSASTVELQPYSTLILSKN